MNRGWSRPGYHRAGNARRPPPPALSGSPSSTGRRICRTWPTRCRCRAIRGRGLHALPRRGAAPPSAVATVPPPRHPTLYRLGGGRLRAAASTTAGSTPDGECAEQPAKTGAFPSKVRIRAYPDPGGPGLIFVYFGEEEAPHCPLPGVRGHGDGVREATPTARPGISTSSTPWRTTPSTAPGCIASRTSRRAESAAQPYVEETDYGYTTHIAGPSDPLARSAEPLPSCLTRTTPPDRPRARPRRPGARPSPGACRSTTPHLTTSA